MVLGITRARPRPVGRVSLAIWPNLTATPRNEDWAAERGSIRCQFRVRVTGGYPGFTQRGVAMGDARLRICDAYLLIDEGNPRGFGLPIQWLDGAAVVARPGREVPALRVFYRDGAAARHFTIRFRGGLRSMRRTSDAERARLLLLDLGLPDRPEDRDPSAPDVRVSWEEARRFEQENVIWRGKATAPTLVGEDTAPADVWLTTRSLIWGASDGDGVNRLALDALSDVVTGQADDRTAVPAVYVAFLDSAVGQVRFDLPFVFDQYPAERNVRERGAFLVGLRSRGVMLGLPAPLIQPWRSTAHRNGAYSDWSRTDLFRAAEDERGVIPGITRRSLDLIGGLARKMPEASHGVQGGWRHPDESTDEPVNAETWRAEMVDQLSQVDRPEPEESDLMLAEFSAPSEIDDAQPRPMASTDIALASEWYEPAEGAALDRYQQEQNGSGPVLPDLEIRRVDDPPRLDCVRSYEAAHLSLLSEALIAIRDRAAGLPGRPLLGTIPDQEMERAAFVELDGCAAAGQITLQEAELRKVRLTAISQAARRLRSLVELRDAGHLTDADLAIKRAEISGELSGLILAGSGLRENR